MLRMNPILRRLLLSLLGAIVLVYFGFGAFIWWAMRRPPETFGRIMARIPARLVFRLYPFETLWTLARAGGLNIGDAAPWFSLVKVDTSGTVSLSTLNKQQPVVLVFGSYT